MKLIKILFWLLCFPTGTTSYKVPTAGVSRPNYGVDFNFLFPINNMHGSWKHVWTIDMHLLDRDLSESFKLDCHLDHTLCKALNDFLLSVSPHIMNMTNWVHKQFGWINDPSMLATINRGTESRVKRSLLPFVGEIEKFFFGVATESDLAGIKSTIDDMNTFNDKTIQQVSRIGDTLASLTKIVNDQIANTESGFSLVKRTFANLTDQVNKRFDHIRSDIDHEDKLVKDNKLAILSTWNVLEKLLPRMLEAVKLAFADIQLLNGIQQILHGYIPISLISPESLREGLGIAYQGIKSEFPSATLSYPIDSLGYYYTHQIVTPYIDVSSISLIVDIPVDLKQEILYVYAIRTFPVALLPYNPYTHTVDPTSKLTTAQSELSLSVDNFIINEDGSMWSTASSVDLLNCKGSIIKSCQRQFALYKFQNEHCLERIWKNMEFSSILENCPYRLSHIVHANLDFKHTQVTSLSSGRWYIEAPLTEKWTITCPSRAPEIRSPCTSCVIQVDCGCGIESKYFHIPTRVSSCDSVFSPLKRNFSVNPFSYLPEKQPWVINLTGDITFPAPVKDTPAITLPDAGQWDDVLESMADKKLDLNKLYMRQKEELKAYKTEAEALLQKIKEQNGIIAELSNWPSWVLGLMVCLTFANSGCIVLFIFCLISRVRARSIAEELILLEQEETAILSIEIINLILNCCILFFLMVYAGPVVLQWIKNRKLIRRIYGAQIRIKADGYRSLRHYHKIMMSGYFSCYNAEDDLHRQIPVICFLGNTPHGSYLVPSSIINNPVSVKTIAGSYRVEFAKPVKIILPNDSIVEPPYFELNISYVHRKLKISVYNVLKDITEIKIWCE